MLDGGQIIVVSGLLIGLVYGSVGLLSGFCLLSGLRGWWADGDGRLVRTYALAIGVAVAATQLLAAAGLVDIGKSIYLQASFSAPVMFFGGLLFGYGMVLSNGCGSRALVLLGRGNLRSFVVVVVLAIFAQMTLKGLIAPSRIALVGGVADYCNGKFGAGAVRRRGPERNGRAHAGGLDHRGGADHLRFCASGVPALAGPDRRGSRGRPVGRGRLVCHRLSRRRRFQSDAGHLAHLHRADRGCAAICHAVHGIDAEFRYRHRVRRVGRQPCHRAIDRTLPPRGLSIAAPHAALGRRRGADGRRRRDGVRLFDRAGPDGIFHAGAGLADRLRRHPGRYRR